MCLYFCSIYVYIFASLAAPPYRGLPQDPTPEIPGLTFQHKRRSKRDNRRQEEHSIDSIE